MVESKQIRSFKGSYKMNIHAARVVPNFYEMEFRHWLGVFSILAFVASCISMAALYQDPFAHLKLCLGGEAPAPKDGTLVLYGHCTWCYLAVGFGLAALIAPPKHS
jgi:hypothetical protein